MKKTLVFIALLLAAQTALSQYFNHLIPDRNFNSDNRQTITTDLHNDIVFITQNTLSPNYPNDFDLIKLDRNGNEVMTKRVTEKMGALTPVSIISTYDGGYLVVGIFDGVPPASYPLVSGSIHTTFYAKFDNSLNIVWFRLHYGYPLANVGAIGRQVEPYGIVAVPGAPVEDYIILNFGTAYDTVTSSSIQTILIDRIDETGTLVREVRPLMAPYYGINILSSISYLPVNNMCAITGAYYNTSVMGFPETPFIFTFDLGLTTVFNYTKYTSAYDNFTPSNVIEDISNPSNLLFCFSTRNPSPFPMTCSSAPKAQSLVYLQVAAGATSIILGNTDYTTPCMTQPRPPLTIKNITGDPGRVMIGFTEVQPIGPSHISYIPSLLRIGTDGSLSSYHHYNPYEQRNKLQYFDNYEADSFVLHINSIDSPLSTRIIKTDAAGSTFCADMPDIQPFIDSIVGIDSTLGFWEDSSALIIDTVVLNDDSIKVVACDTNFHRPAAQAITDKTTMSVFPSPTQQELNVVLEGQVDEPREIIIVNSMGQEVKRKEIFQATKTTITIDVSELSTGVYFIQLVNSRGILVRDKFIKL